jgi:hypothetical protein
MQANNHQGQQSNVAAAMEKMSEQSINWADISEHSDEE